jgi:ribosomal protein S1
MMAVVVLRTMLDEQSLKSSKTTNTKRIELSVKSKDVNQGVSHAHLYKDMRLRGSIESVQDHGYVVNTGMNGVTAFLPFDNVRLKSNEEHDDDVEMSKDAAPIFMSRAEQRKLLTPGRALDFHVGSLSRNQDNTRTVVQLVLLEEAGSDLMEHDHSARIREGQLKDYDLKSLQAGMLVSCRIEAQAKNGLLVNFFNGTYRGSIEMNHLGAMYPSSKTSSDSKDWHDILKQGKVKNVLARIVVVDATSKLIRLSLLPHVLKMQRATSKELPPLGTTIQNAVVLRVDKGIGALLAIPADQINVSGDNDNTSEDADDQSDDEVMDPVDDDDDDSSVDSAKLKLKRKQALVAKQKKKRQALTFLSIPEHKEASKTRGVYVSLAKALDHHKTDNKSSSTGLSNKMEREMELAKLFKVGQVAPSVRIISNQSLMDNIAGGATATSLLEAQVLSYKDLVPGQLYRNVVIVRTGDYGVVVSLGQNIQALLSFANLYDKVPTQNAETMRHSKQFTKAFGVGKKLNSVRCLSVDARQQKCQVTYKPSLVKDTGKLFTSVEQSQSPPSPSDVVKGFVAKVSDRGIMVCFYNNVHGWCTAQSLQRELGVTNIAERYKVGDVVKCRVIKIEVRNQKSFVGLSLDTSSQAVAAAKASNPKELDQASGDKKSNDDHIEPGAVFSKGGVIVQLVDHEDTGTSIGGGYAVVTYPTLNVSRPGVECRLPYSLMFERPLGSHDSDVDASDAQQREDHVKIQNLVHAHFHVGQTLDTEAVVLSTKHSSGFDQPILNLSIKAKLIEAAKQEAKKRKAGDAAKQEATNGKKAQSSRPFLPSSAVELFIGANVIGYVVRVDSRYGSFVRFLNNLTGIIPKSKQSEGGNSKQLPLYSTVICRVKGLDMMEGKSNRPPRILLQHKSSEGSLPLSDNDKKRESPLNKFKVGECVGAIKVLRVNAHRVKVEVMDRKYQSDEERDGKIEARIHVSMAISKKTKDATAGSSKAKKIASDGNGLTREHPFYKWNSGKVIQSGFHVVAIEERGGDVYVELSNAPPSSKSLVKFFESEEQVKQGQVVSGVISEVDPKNQGLRIELSPGIHGFVSALELEEHDAHKLNHMKDYFAIGDRLEAVVLPSNPRASQKLARASIARVKDVLLSVVLFKHNNDETEEQKSRPAKGALVMGHIKASLNLISPPALMFELRNNRGNSSSDKSSKGDDSTMIGRCCVTELDDVKKWENMPLSEVYRSRTKDERSIPLSTQDNDDDGSDNEDAR